MKPSCVKKTIHAGKGKVPEYREGTKAVFHYEVLRPIDPVRPESGMPEGREAYISIDDTRKKWPGGYGQPLELVFGKKFQLPIFETCLRSMLVDEISQFDVEQRELVSFPMVSKKLRDIARPCDGHDHGHATHMCAASMAEGTGYPALDEYMKSPTPLRIIFHLQSVTQPEDYKPDGWQLNSEEKLASVETLREEGNEHFKKKEYKEAEIRYREALQRLDHLLLREKPGEPEWVELDQKALQSLCPNNPHFQNVSLYLNLSQCLLNTGNFYEAQSAATEVLNRDAVNEKALYRRAKALIETWKLEEAEADLSRLLEEHPKSKKLVEQERLLIQQRREEKMKGSKETSKKMCKAFGN